MLNSQHLNRNDKLRLLADGSPVPLPAGMLEAALASQQSVTDFALVAADLAATARQAERVYQREFEERVTSIFNSDAPAASVPSADPAVELAARRILEA